VARRLTEEGTPVSGSPARYCYIWAKFVFLEECRKPKPTGVGVEFAGDNALRPGAPLEIDRDQPLHRLERCLETLSPGDRELILDYYRGDQRAKIENRRRLASLLGVTMNALSIRACRIRDALENCVKRHGAEKST
jgi:DNA-directed RNA polymerase specialized sigma24 family protein